MDEQWQIKAKREAAARARRLLVAAFDRVTRTRLIAFAEALEAEVEALEKRKTVTIPSSEPALRAAPLAVPDLPAMPTDPDKKPKF